MTMWIHMKRHFAVRAPEWLNGLTLVAWGGYVVLNPHMFASARANGGLHMLTDLAPQEVWGLGAFIVGAVRVVALFINGQWGVTPIIRVLTSYVSAFFWFLIAADFLRAGVPQLGVVMYSSLLASDMVSVFRAAGDAYEAEAMKRLHKLSEAGANVSSIGRGAS